MAVWRTDKAGRLPAAVMGGDGGEGHAAGAAVQAVAVSADGACVRLLSAHLCLFLLALLLAEQDRLHHQRPLRQSRLRARCRAPPQDCRLITTTENTLRTFHSLLVFSSDRAAADCLVVSGDAAGYLCVRRL